MMMMEIMDKDMPRKEGESDLRRNLFGRMASRLQDVCLYDWNIEIMRKTCLGRRRSLILAGIEHGVFEQRPRRHASRGGGV